jgi:large subunit ribosomal protein L21
MYAVIETGGKQYRVELGTQIEVDRLDVQAGQTIQLDRVLLVADGDDSAIGRPVVEGATVSADVVRQERDDKVVVFKYKPKARRRVKKGHRAELTVLRVADIAWSGRSAASEHAALRAEERAAAEEASKAAEAKAAADRALAEQLEAKVEEAKAAEASGSKASTRSRRPAAGADEAARSVASADENAGGAQEAPRRSTRSRARKDE